MEAERKVECLDCMTPEHKEVICKCACHWPTVEDLRRKISDIFESVEYYTDNRRERRMTFSVPSKETQTSSMSLMRFVNALFGAFNGFPVFYITTSLVDISDESYEIFLKFEVRY